MAEQSPRPISGEDSEEEGEEAAEAAVLEYKQKASELEDCIEKAALASLEPPPEEKKGSAANAEPPPEEKKATLPAMAAQPLLPAPAALHHPGPPYPARSPTHHTPAAPAFPTSGVNAFANDGSFLELFKKKMEQSPAGNKEEEGTQEDKKPEPDKRKPISFVGKRRGGAKLALKTGLVAKKPKTDEEEEVVLRKGGAWAQYMAEVKKYKAHQCSDDDKTRPLVK